MTEQEFIEKACLAGIDTIQLTKITTEEDSVEYVNEIREKYDMSSSVIYQIKAEKDGKTVKALGNYLEEDLLDTILMKFQYIETQNADSYLTNIEDNNQPIEKASFDITETCLKIEASIAEKKEENITKIKVEYIRYYQQTQIMNNKGVSLNTSTNNYVLHVEVACSKNEKNVVTRKTMTQAQDDFDFSKILEEEIKEAKHRIDEIILKTGKYRVLIQNKVAGKLINNIMRGLNADEIQKKTSIFQEMKDQKIASPILNIIEDPTDINYPGYTLFDREGTKTKRKEVIKNGVLQTYFYNNKTAMKDHVSSTANEYGGIATSNLYVVPGEKSEEELIKELSTGVIVTYFTCGEGSISLEQGNVSLQIFGYYVEDGKIKGGIKPAILTTTFDEILNNLEDIGNDLLFSTTHTGSPSLLFDNLNIASDN